ncbi:MAG: DUF2341 domain-containing protein [Thermoplasmatales archaeon]|nr:MAG: DUF2341 domain-containing protein [Thermoplasmatales archaeon]
MGIISAFSGKFITSNKRHKKEKSDSHIYQNLDYILSDKNTLVHIDDIDYLVDSAIIKKRASSYVGGVKNNCSSGWLFRRGGNRKAHDIVNKLIVRKVISVLLSVLLVFVAITSASILSSQSGSSIDVLSISISPENVYNNDSVFVNVTIPNAYNITSVSADMADVEIIDLLLVDNTTSLHLWQSVWFVHDVTPGEHIVTITGLDMNNTPYSARVRWSVLPEDSPIDNQSSELEINETIVSVGLNLTLGVDKNSYVINETVTIFGVVTYNDSLINTPVDLLIVGPDLNLSAGLNALDNRFDYEFVPVVVGSYTVRATVSYLNETVQEEVLFDVLDITVENVSVELSLTLQSDKDVYAVNETVLINGIISYNNSFINTSVSLLVDGLDYNLSENLNATYGEFSYQFIPSEIGNYIVQVKVSYENETVTEEVDFYVWITPPNITVEASELYIWDDTDNETKYVGDMVTFYTNYTNDNLSILNASCLISFNVGEWTESTVMNYTNGLYVYSRTFDIVGIHQFRVWCSAAGYENKTAVDEIVVSEVVSNVSEVSIIDLKEDEYVYVVPGTSFYVERTINGPNGISAVFAPLFSDGLTIEKFEIIKGGLATGQALEIVRDVTPQVFAADKGVSIVERRIDNLRDSLPANVKQLNRVSYSESFGLNGPVTVRVWFKTPSWEEIKSGVVPSSGHISYLTFTGNSFDFEDSTWWNANWGNRKLITINSSQVNTDLTNFPILVYNSSDSDLATHAQSDGDDIAFVLYSDNTTQLNHEIENYTASGQIVAWVNVTRLSSSSDTKIWMYYNNSGCSSQENVIGTWNSGYKGVWHLAETPSGADDIKDSTGTYNGTSQDMESTDQVTGQVNGCLLFDGNGEYVLMPDSSDWTLSSNLNWTLEGWFNLSVLPGGSDWDNMIGTPSDVYCFEFNEDGGDTTLNWWDGISDHESSGQSSISTNEFHYGVLVLDFGVTSGSRWYLDGSSLGTFTAENRDVNPTGLTISGESASTYFTGNLDEIRFSNVLRNASWINTAYNTVNNCSSTFLSFESEETFEINTSVDTIIPYNVIVSPKTITAAGSTGLDNVTLWYRYTSNNSTWWNNNWDKRKLINITSVNASTTLTYFPVLINITKETSMQPDYDDLRFIDYSDNTTMLNYEIENTTGSYVLVWVNCTLYGSIIKIWMYYGNDASTSGENPNSVWNSDYVGVWHLKENPGPGGTGDIKDSTANSNNGTAAAEMTSDDQVPGQIDGSVDFDGSNDYISISDPGTGSVLDFDTSDNITLSVWIKPTSLPSFGVIFNKNPYGNMNYGLQTEGQKLNFYYRNSGDTSWHIYQTDSNVFSAGNWYYLTFIYTFGTGNSAKIYVNSNEEASSWTSGNGNDDPLLANDPLWFGADDNSPPGSPDEEWNGIIDEIRISNNIRSEDWINQSYQLIINQVSYIEFDSEEAVGWQKWIDISNPDTAIPWNWTYDFPNGTGYYEFYSIGNKSGTSTETSPDNADAICYYNPLGSSPSISLINPTPNGTTDVSQQPNCKIWANDSNGDTLNVYWYENTTGSWILRNINSSVSADSIVSYTFTEFNNYSTTYWWKIAVNDSIWNTTAVYHFTTEPILTSVDKIAPYNQSTFSLTINSTGNTDLDNVSLYYRWSNDNSSWDVSFKNWWNSNWGKRKLITVNSSQISTDLTNFPMLVYRSSDSDLSNSAQSDGDDIIFVLYSDNTTYLNHEIGLYNNSTGELAAWVNVTSLSSSVDTKIWMYYNNSACSSQENVSGTWDSNYEIIWHLQDEGNGTTDEYKDSSSNSCHGTGGKDDDSGGVGNASETPDRVTGKFGYAQDFNVDGATGDRISSQNLSSVWSAVTGSIWIYGNAAGDDRIWGKSWGGGLTDNTILMRCIGTGASTLGARFRTDTSSTTGYQPASMENNQWIYMVLTWDGSDDDTVRIYKNGVLQGSGLTVSGSTLYGSPPHEFFTLGNVGDGAENRCFDGYIQEARMSSIRRNISWINTEYNNQNNPTTFLDFDNEESYTKEDTWNFYETDLASPWNWSFNFPNGTGYYEFYSIGNKSGTPNETAPDNADARCYNNLTTMVDPITPYNRTTSPLTITANGNSDFDNVTLYYRWSQDNITWKMGSEKINWSSELLTNSNFETGNTTGWTNWGGGTMTVGTDCPYGSQGPDGTYYAYWLQNNWDLNSYAYQNVSLDSYAARIDAGQAKINVTGWFVSDEYNAGPPPYDESFMNVRFYNATNENMSGCWYESGGTNPVSQGSGNNLNSWTQYGITNYTIPVGARKVQIRFLCWEYDPSGPTFWDSGSAENFSVTVGIEDYNWTEFGIDSSYPWSWNFNFPNGTGYYEFYSIGNKSGWPNETKPDNSDALCKYNRQSTITNEGPTNQSIGIPLTPQMNITVIDIDGWTMNVTWYSNSSGTWQVFGTNSSVVNGTYHQTNTNFSKTGKTYWWYVTVNDGLDINTSAIFHFTTTETAPPQVTTNSSTGVEENNATLWGYLYDEGGESCTGRFEYGTTTSYGTNTTNQTISEGEEFSVGISGLSNGTLYYYRAYANNTIGSDTGSNMTFLTKPQPPTSLTAQMNNSNTIYLKWTAGNGANITYIERNTTSNWARGEGTMVYNSTTSLYENSGLTEGTTYYYQAWSYTNWTAGGSTLHQWSDDNASASNKTNNNPTIEVISPANESTGISLQPTCQIWVNDTDSDTLDVYWYENSTESWVLNQINNSVTANSTLSWTFSQASNYGIIYWWKVAINDSIDNTTAWFYFTTESLNTSVNTITPYEVITAPLTITATNNTPTDNVTLYYRWSKDNITWSPTYDTITIDNTASETDNTGATSMNWTHTVSSGLNNSILIVCANIEDDDAGNNYFVESADFNGDALTRAVRVAADEGYTAISEIWYLLSPDAGSHTITVNFSIAVNNALGGSVSFSNVNQSTPVYTNTSTDTGNPTGLATGITTDVANSLIIDVATDGQGTHAYSYGNGQNQFYNVPGNTHEGAGSYRIPSGTGGFTMYTNLSSASNRMSQVVATWIPSSTMINCTNWAVWNDATNPDTVSPWSWNFNFPNSTGYYEFYSMGKKTGSSDETPSGTADAICHWIENTTINVKPSEWNQGDVLMGSSNATTGFYFNLSHEGNLQLNVLIKASNATNTTTGAEWKLNLTPGHDDFSVQYNKSGGGTWTNINTTFDTFVINLNIDAWKTFDLNLIMATSTSKNDPLSFTITFKSIVS